MCSPSDPSPPPLLLSTAEPSPASSVVCPPVSTTFVSAATAEAVGNTLPAPDGLSVATAAAWELDGAPPLLPREDALRAPIMRSIIVVIYGGGGGRGVTVKNPPPTPTRRLSQRTFQNHQMLRTWRHDTSERLAHHTADWVALRRWCSEVTMPTPSTAGFAMMRNRRKVTLGSTAAALQPGHSLASGAPHLPHGNAIYSDSPERVTSVQPHQEVEINKRRRGLVYEKEDLHILQCRDRAV